MIKLKCKPYSAEVYFTDSLAEFNHKVKRQFNGALRDTFEGTRGCTAHSGDRKVSIVGVFDGTRGTLVHELAHATFNIMDYIGQPVDAEHSEAFCYLQTDLYEQAVKYLDKKEQEG